MKQVDKHQNFLRLIRLEMELGEFPKYLKAGLEKSGERLRNAEDRAQELIETDFQSDECENFIKAVCLWGDDPRRAGKVLKRNSPKDISRALCAAYKATQEGKVLDALQAITSLEGLAVSFGSKHLKFLNPNRHVVLDSIISERLGYTRDKQGKGYMNWLAACHQYLQLVTQNKVEYLGTGQCGWRVSDIEMAIFNKIRSE